MGDTGTVGATCSTGWGGAEADGGVTCLAGAGPRWVVGVLGVLGVLGVWGVSTESGPEEGTAGGGAGEAGWGTGSPSTAARSGADEGTTAAANEGVGRVADVSNMTPGRVAVGVTGAVAIDAVDSPFGEIGARP
jgi:hypothetical protein